MPQNWRRQRYAKISVRAAREVTVHTAVAWAVIVETKGEEHMSMLTELKEFALKGNVVDMAVGVIIGGASLRPAFH